MPTRCRPARGASPHGAAWWWPGCWSPAAIRGAGDAIADALAQFEGLTPVEIRDRRAEKFLAIGRTL